MLKLIVISAIIFLQGSYCAPASLQAIGSGLTTDQPIGDNGTTAAPSNTTKPKRIVELLMISDYNSYLTNDYLKSYFMNLTRDINKIYGALPYPIQFELKGIMKIKTEEDSMVFLDAVLNKNTKVGGLRQLFNRLDEIFAWVPRAKEFDLQIFFTSKNFSVGGAATRPGVCGSRNAMIQTELNNTEGYIYTLELARHELGHSLGAGDNVANTTLEGNPSIPCNTDGTVMSGNTRPELSQCSIMQIEEALAEPSRSCIYETNVTPGPFFIEYKIPSYRDYQINNKYLQACRSYFNTSDASYLPYPEPCIFECYQTEDLTKTKKFRWPDGTACGMNKTCKGGQCE